MFVAVGRVRCLRDASMPRWRGSFWHARTRMDAIQNEVDGF
jgi:hypothetical protein